MGKHAKLAEVFREQIPAPRPSESNVPDYFGIEVLWDMHDVLMRLDATENSYRDVGYCVECFLTPDGGHDPTCPSVTTFDSVGDDEDD